jgi:DNA-binding NarL/FixJ family response regulator
MVDPTLRDLTPRQRQVALAVTRGLSNRQLARELKITVGTVKLHLVHIYEKTGARNRTVLAAWTLKQRLEHQSAPKRGSAAK